ncbi:sulfite reductase subunit alpha [Roseomonas sp. NAR14]|uniref:assimilatory sulfite reductase (NADPH) n=1 Tax=Roseomonas acroporae TaxID=2937791 RepID=A0A9X1Y4N9_9PROT|nr:sulfite reductase subunit alpha [Roseomonas acroporae]MCK8782995.1 sulfite reductase subunit alpha [Roseomonas acroporae]
MNAIVPSGAPAKPPVIPMIPESAPFSPAQRAWLNGFLAGLYGEAQAGAAGMSTATALAAPEEEEFPWHDPAVELPERLKLAEGRPMSRRLMACMAQLDCGQCGYLCQSYAEAIAEGRETSLSLCVPGAKATSKALKALVAEAPAAKPAAAPATKPARPLGEPVSLLSAARLTAAASAKDVRHVVIDLTASGLRYEPGDSIGVQADNDPALAAACLAALGATGDESVPGIEPGTVPLRAAFLSERDIARPLDRTLDLLAGTAKDPAEAKALRALADGDDGAEPDAADLLDLLEAFPSARPPLDQLVASLPVLKPRLYSIASSPLAVPGRVELCMSVVRAERRGRVRDGVASCHLGHRCDAGTPLRAYIQGSHFRLPANPEAPVIMCGPGTGIAPFRAFLQHRAALGLKGGLRGRTWLFFGDQREAADFLFRDELEAWQADGTLARLSLAWSRDGARKVYVQDRMRESGAELWRWFQDGAHFYVCGDASRMAKDVDAALREIAMREGQLSADQARDWLGALGRQGRYQRDVY